MTIWAISDLHLSFSNAKPMHIFGEHWRNHPDKIARNWRARVAPEDVVLVPGDVSWASRFRDSLTDLRWVDALPGARKLIVRGNHDAWWPKTGAERAQLPPSLLLLEGDAVALDGQVFCGTGGWLSPRDPYYEPLDRPRYERELAAWDAALEAGSRLAAGGPLHALIHFSPYSSVGLPTAFAERLAAHRVRSVTYGHFHLRMEWDRAPRGMRDGVHWVLAACDYLDFDPVRVDT